jgi:hypothetical protein
MSSSGEHVGCRISFNIAKTYCTRQDWMSTPPHPEVRAEFNTSPPTPSAVLIMPFLGRDMMLAEPIALIIFFLICTGATTAHTMEISTVGVSVANFTIGPFRCHITPIFHLGRLRRRSSHPCLTEMILIELRSRSSNALPGHLHKLCTYGFLLWPVTAVCFWFFISSVISTFRYGSAAIQVQATYIPQILPETRWI